MDQRTEWQRRVGVGERQAAHIAANDAAYGTRTTPVLGDDGSRAGKVVGWRTEHSDGRVDAVAQPETVRLEGRIVNGARDYSTVTPKGTS